MKIRLYGKEVDFSEEQLVAILEEHFERKSMEAAFIDTVTEVPSEGSWFIVKPKSIDQRLFEGKREDARQENVRSQILKAFEEMRRHPEMAEPFKTLYPARPWTKHKGKTLKELHNMAKLIGEDEANETQQALEWAQRISNGETWEEVCNTPDKAHSYRVIQTKYPGMYAIIGGSTDAEPKTKVEVSHVLQETFMYYEKVGCAVPLVVSHKNIN